MCAALISEPRVRVMNRDLPEEKPGAPESLDGNGRWEDAPRRGAAETGGGACPQMRHAETSHLSSCLMSEETHTLIDLGRVRRLALMVTPEVSGEVRDEAWEAVSTVRAILKQQSRPMRVTLQTVFLRRAEDELPCRRVLEAYFGSQMPATQFVVQPPCGGQSLALEAWAIGGDAVTVQYPAPDVVTVNYDGLRWIYAGGVVSPMTTSAYDQTQKALRELARRLGSAGATFGDVVRTWLYMGSITGAEGDTERYRELNRARTDFFREQEEAGRMIVQREGAAFYPASTGIGMGGDGLVVGCMALQTSRTDVRLQPLENPCQTSAFQYAQHYSLKSPKFSRAMAVDLGAYVTTWISGTASIVNAESVHLGDVAGQTEQTIDNIERLISRENMERHGLHGAGARLEDLAKMRVYVKHADDVATCRAICERRFGRLPAVYAQADVCRADLLVEIEGVAFSPRNAERSAP